MIFFAYPLGLDSQQRQRAVFAWVLLAVLIYRIGASFFLVGVQPHLLAYFPFAQWGAEIPAAALQSVFTPVFPHTMTTDHLIAGIAGVCAVILFWTIFGPALETALGHGGFLLFLAGAAVVSIVVAIMPWMSMSAVYWAGHGVFMVAVGMAAVLFASSNVKVGWYLWTPFAAGNGTWSVPVFFFLLPMAGAGVLAQSMIWFTRFEPDFVVRHALVPPTGWNSILLAVGVVMGLFRRKWSGASASAAAAEG